MKIKEALDSIQKAHPEDTLQPLYTPWGEKLTQADSADVWPEYPRPQLERDNYRILNGIWSCWFVPADNPSAPAEKQEILVPFSPESLLSGVGRQLQPEEYLWYERTVSFSAEELTQKEKGLHCILHFGAADQQAVVYCNSRETARHNGGYLPFSADITEYVSTEDMLLQVRIRDVSDTSWHTRGKQTLNRGGMFYTAQSGIWQSVWYEWVPANYIRGMKITPDIDQNVVTIELDSPKEFFSVSCTVYKAIARSSVGAPPSDRKGSGLLPGERTIALIGVAVKRESTAPNTLQLFLPEDSICLWTPETPYLYSFTVMADNDTIHGYFALRSFSVEPDDKGILRFCLNHRPYFLHGLLDQGYWPDGLMTAPCDDAFIYDIELAKKTGFNMLRKHIKIEPLRWYYHCDRIGMIVWQDMVNGGTAYRMPYVCYLPTVFPNTALHTRDHHYKLFSRADEEGRLEWEQECRDTVEHLYSVPSIAVWVPFNEGWGQFDAARITARLKELDPTRPIDHASGWFDQKAGDFKSIHNYFRTLKAKPDKRRAFVISEYGGYACHIAGHSSLERAFGYRKYDTPEALDAAYRQLIDRQLTPLIEQGLSGAVYTQLSDIEEEVNGLVTYDRKVVKIGADGSQIHAS
ncbi:MAG: glycoside hydrolase family 2 [Roseburia sp.]|nr:glycoside hydrolase family 2 [Roseburia sp.]MCM1099546.1 glycoside hydrolase family 2 [Ruminococcus flavefaciens]